MYRQSVAETKKRSPAPISAQTNCCTWDIFFTATRHLRMEWHCRPHNHGSQSMSTIWGPCTQQTLQCTQWHCQVDLQSGWANDWSFTTPVLLLKGEGISVFSGADTAAQSDRLGRVNRYEHLGWSCEARTIPWCTTSVLGGGRGGASARTW